jgi:hypothetical protein
MDGWRHFWWPQPGKGVLLTSGGQRVRMMLNILQFAGATATGNCPAHNINKPRLRKLGLNPTGPSVQTQFNLIMRPFGRGQGDSLSSCTSPKSKELTVRNGTGSQWSQEREQRRPELGRGSMQPLCPISVEVTEALQLEASG